VSLSVVSNHPKYAAFTHELKHHILHNIVIAILSNDDIDYKYRIMHACKNLNTSVTVIYIKKLLRKYNRSN